MNKKLLTLLSGAALLFGGDKAHASSFFLIEQSVSAMGTAYASGSAYAEDASTIWFNPAGLTTVDGSQCVLGLHGVIPVVYYDDDGSMAATSLPPAVDALTPLTPEAGFEGADGRNAGEFAVVPHSYFSTQLSPCLWFGLGVTSPFGLATDYARGWTGRYYADRSEVLTVNINPSIAWKINKQWSIGAGFSAMYLHAKLSNALDLGLQAGAPQALDGRAELKGSSWGFGGNVGITYEPRCGTRIGASYRSEVKHDVKGNAKFEVPPPFNTFPDFQDTTAKADLTLPMQASISAYHALTRCFAIMGDITWTKWDSLQTLRFQFDSVLDDEITTFNWKNTLRYSIGAHYRPSEHFIARFGVSYDETPVPNKERRTPRIPDNDRFWIATGFGYDICNNIHLDVGYAHLFAKDPEIDKLTDFTDASHAEDWTKGGLFGHYAVRTDIISVQVVVGF